jgi:hypothetical protein
MNDLNLQNLKISKSFPRKIYLFHSDIEINCESVCDNKS